jgi:NTE family protein
MAAKAKNDRTPKPGDPAPADQTRTGQPAMSATQGPQRHLAKRVNLALQGGGSHGAFTWGVLDRLLEDHRIVIDSLCGTSAGAMNAAVLVSGDSKDGRNGAREAMRLFWSRIGEAGRYGPLQRTVFDRILGGWRLDYSPSYLALDVLSRVFSPYQLNPLKLNPLRQILEETIDFDAVRYAPGIRLFVCATNVRSGKVKVFSGAEVTVDALLASACLPDMFQAVEIAGEFYYDGGYMGNPALFPLQYESDTNDLVVVQINPLRRDEIPQTAREIQDRVSEISFNATLMREMRAIHFVNRLIDSGQLEPADYKRTNIHLIEAADEMKELHASSKVNSDPELLDYLFRLGRASAEEWIEKNFDMLGVRSSIDVAKTYL